MKGWIIVFAGWIFSQSATAQKDISWDIKKGNETAEKIEKSIGLTHLPDAEATVKKVGDRLVSHLTSNPFTFTFHIIDQPEPNAFALPGGHVYVSRGILALIINEDELAGVLGHEISHVTQRHSAKQQKKAILPTIIAVPGIIVGSTIGGSLGEKVAAPLLGAGKLFLASYSRKQETEADDLGIALAAKAGYKPSALGDILHRMELSLQSETGEARPFSFFNDHPMTPDRMKAIVALSQNIQIASGDHLFSQEGFLNSFNTLPFGSDPAQGIFNKNTYLHPSLKIYWTLPSGWTYANEATVAGAVSKESQILVTIAGKEQQIDTLINNFVNGYYAKTRKQPISDGKLKLKDRTASEIILPGSQSNKILYTVWFRKDKMTYLILAVGDQNQTEVFRQSCMTFRDLDDVDFKEIFSKELVILSATENETSIQLTDRTGKAVTPKFTAIINGLDEDGKFQKGHLVKAIQSKPYQPKTN